MYPATRPPPPASFAGQARTATHRKLHVPKATKSSCVGGRTAGSQEESWTTRAHGFHPDAGFPALPEYYPPADAPGLARSVEAFLLSFSGRRCPFRLRSKKDRLLGHGFVRTGDSRIDVRSRIGYRPVDTATGVPCFARKHGTPLASSDRTRDSIPHGVHSPDSGAKHLRYLGTGCSDRWFPISRTASSEHLPPQTNASISCSGNSIEVDFVR